MGKMVDRRSAGVWIIALLIVGLFVASTSISSSIQDPSGNDGKDGVIKEGLDYKKPSITSNTNLRELKNIDIISIKVLSMPQQEFLIEGGEWIWVFKLEGNLGPNDAVINYGSNNYVAWTSVSDRNAIVGLGPGFSQGPSSATSPREIEFDLNIIKSGKYVLKVWIMDQKSLDIGMIHTSSPLSRSPYSELSLVISEYKKPYVQIDQRLTAPRGDQETGKAVRLKLTDRADRGDTDWTGTIVDRISIEKDGIKISDVYGSVRSPSSSIKWSQNDDVLNGALKTTEPFSEKGLIGWTVDIDLIFETDGTYVIKTWAEDENTKEIVSDVSSISVRVLGNEPEPKPEPEPEPELNDPDDSFLSRLFRTSRQR